MGQRDEQNQLKTQLESRMNTTTDDAIGTVLLMNTLRHNGDSKINETN